MEYNLWRICFDKKITQVIITLQMKKKTILSDRSCLFSMVFISRSIEPHREKSCLPCFRPGQTQTMLYWQRRRIEA